MKLSHTPTYPIKHFLDNYDLAKEEIQDILTTIIQLKEAAHQNAVPQLLRGATLAMIFEEPSTRTRVSFETAMAELGGHGLYLKPGEIHFGSHEAIKDTAQVLSSMCDGIMLRTEDHELVLTLAKYASVPVFNAMTYYIHPTQGLADVLTMMEHLPKGKSLEEVEVVFVGDSGENGIMAMEHAHLAASLGLHYTIASPKQYSISDAEIKKVEEKMQKTGGTLTVTENVEEAVKKADFIIPDVWYYYGYEDEKDERTAAFYPRYQLNMEMLEMAPDHCKAMHCLPANREVEITSEVLDHPTRSLVFQEAENRLHVQRGLLAWYLYPQLKRADDQTKAYYEGKMRAFLDQRLN
ncbi:ornithine carbamoyltransferase [Candidatus Enterococcus ferrettii]|uniref:Ornithine carbamoyltransferase n=1 Tax=Candidatus Enterococcus ferrettii TaxID=2815324 RepID=A0ABV0EU29_9ENTE|nr:ornithine carbamoyltransferase [Enterococcus sp. 665A]MBO1339554.1 ornithine carbamoyltransferase [Enterococcus sp. 665A]